MTDVERPLNSFRIDEFNEFYKNNNNNKTQMNRLFLELLYRRSSRVNKGKNIKKKFTAILELVHEEISFKWPSTDAPTNENPKTSIKEMKEDGLLLFYGYRVDKKNAKPSNEREIILSDIYENEILSTAKKKFDTAYIAKFGEPKTGQRLKQIASTIASFTRNAKRRKTHDFSFAINNWENDLATLKSNFYDGVYDLEFLYPSTSIE
tara:strand:+ start:754 stop:1374 length:621 start_codon:yes stop_codon:yes gene_type:complete